MLIDRLLRRTVRHARPATHADSPHTNVGEITPCDARVEQRAGARLNLLLPSISKQHYFGGIHTAVLVYREFCRHFPSSRIILIDSEPDEEALLRFADHELVRCGAESAASRQIVPFNDRYGRTLPVCEGDHWLATAWWTAHAAQRLAQWQFQACAAPDRPIAYLIQDFEPGFYAWSSQSALALSTYRKDKDFAIFNTSLLRDYFSLQGLAYAASHVFEPVLHEGLRAHLATLRAEGDRPRERTILVYARPGTPRNAFEVLCEGLRRWGWTDARSAQWNVLAVGELDSDVDLGPMKLKALGKLSIERYAELLTTSAIGVSLMVSPHPSYPPLEMNAFGVAVITNAFANKDLSRNHANIASLRSVTPEAIAATLSQQVDLLEERGMRGGALIDDVDPYLGKGDNFSRIADAIAAQWGATVGA